jgi:hypothetical protein
MIVTHFGINKPSPMEEPQDLLELDMEPEKNQEYFSTMPGTRLVLPENSLNMVALHYYMGLSRATMASTLNFLTIDAPIFNWPIENSINLPDKWVYLQRKIR